MSSDGALVIHLMQGPRALDSCQLLGWGGGGRLQGLTENGKEANWIGLLTLRLIGQVILEAKWAGNGGT